jgi:Nif-specific regulatory protein
VKERSYRDKYEALVDIARQLGGLHSTSELLQTIIALAKEILEADRGFAMVTEGDLPPPKGDAPGVRIETTGGFQKDATHAMLAISGSVLRHVLESGESVLSVDAQDDTRFDGAQSILAHDIRSVACAPMKIRDRVFGALYVDWRGAEASLDTDAIELLEAMATQAASALHGYELAENLEAENRKLRNRLTRPPELVGESAAMQRVFRLMEKILPTDAPVLILGESGTGKELVARALHDRGSRSGKAFVAQFCGALPETLLESELFGHKKGSFTGAVADKKGLFELADGGTFFLDEVADLSLATQTKLLRVLEEGEFRPVGDIRLVKVDIRLIAATNRNMEDELKAERFREDLFYRLNLFTIQMPPLRDRGRDALLIADVFLQRFTHELGLPVKRLSTEAKRALAGHSWPGNVRELRNVVHRALLVSEEEQITAGDLDLELEPGGLEAGDKDEDQLLDSVIRRTVLRRLEQLDGNRTRTAKSLGVSLRWLQYRLRAWHQ